MPQAISQEDTQNTSDTIRVLTRGVEQTLHLHLCCISSQVSLLLFLINNERKSSHSPSSEVSLTLTLDSSSQHAFIQLPGLAVASRRMYQLRNVVTFKLWVPARPQSSAHDPRECSPTTEQDFAHVSSDSVLCHVSHRTRRSSP